MHLNIHGSTQRHYQPSRKNCPGWKTLTSLTDGLHVVKSRSYHQLHEEVQLGWASGQVKDLLLEWATCLQADQESHQGRNNRMATMVRLEDLYLTTMGLLLHCIVVSQEFLQENSNVAFGSRIAMVLQIYHPNHRCHLEAFVQICEIEIEIKDHLVIATGPLVGYLMEAAVLEVIKSIHTYHPTDNEMTVMADLQGEIETGIEMVTTSDLACTMIECTMTALVVLGAEEEGEEEVEAQMLGIETGEDRQSG